MTSNADVSQLPAGVDLPSDLIGTWVVAQLFNGRREKSLARDLADTGIGYYLPLQHVVRRDLAGKRRTNDLPLFPGYLPVCLPHPAYWYDIVHCCKGVGDPIKVADQGRFKSQLDGVCAALACGAVEPYPGIAAGKRCRVVRGPMMGHEGIVERINGGRHVLVMRIEMFRQSIAMDIDPADVEPI